MRYLVIVSWIQMPKSCDLSNIYKFLITCIHFIMNFLGSQAEAGCQDSALPPLDTKIEACNTLFPLSHWNIEVCNSNSIFLLLPFLWSLLPLKAIYTLDVCLFCTFTICCIFYTYSRSQLVIIEIEQLLVFLLFYESEDLVWLFEGLLLDSTLSCLNGYILSFNDAICEYWRMYCWRLNFYQGLQIVARLHYYNSVHVWSMIILVNKVVYFLRKLMFCRNNKEDFPVYAETSNGDDQRSVKNLPAKNTKVIALNLQLLFLSLWFVALKFTHLVSSCE